MRRATLALVGALGLAAFAMSANAAPAVPGSASDGGSGIVQVAGGCGRGWHPDPWGRCVPYRYGYYPPHYYRQPYWPGYYGGGYEPWNRPSPTDHVANELNHQVRIYNGY